MVSSPNIGKRDVVHRNGHPDVRVFACRMRQTSKADEGLLQDFQVVRQLRRSAPDLLHADGLTALCGLLFPKQKVYPFEVDGKRPLFPTGLSGAIR